MANLKQFVFDTMLSDYMKSKGSLALNTEASFKWFQNKVKNYSISRTRIISEGRGAGRMKAKFVPGKMYFFSYDAKTKDELFAWDAFPVIFVVDKAPGGFYGINLHYCPPGLRIAFLRQLYALSTDQTFTQATKLKISYQILKAMSGQPIFKPCFKHYLTKQMRTDFVEIVPAEWTASVFLPVANWQKASERQVWNWARKQV